MSGAEKRAVATKRQVSAAWLVPWLVRKPLVRKTLVRRKWQVTAAGYMARLHPKGQYPSPVSIAVSTKNRVAKLQVATWLPAKDQYERAGWYEWAVRG